MVEAKQAGPPIDPTAADWSTIPLFQHCQPSSLKLFSNSSEHKRATKNTQLFRQGQACPGIILLTAGVIRLTGLSSDGKEHILRIARAGDTIGEVIAVDGGQALVSATASTHISYTLIPRDAVQEALARDHAFAQYLIRIFGKRIQQLITLIQDIVLRDAVSRVARCCLEQSPDTLIGAADSKREIALHLNITPETYSRALKRLVQIGCLTTDGAISDRDSLHDLIQ